MCLCGVECSGVFRCVGGDSVVPAIRERERERER